MRKSIGGFEGCAKIPAVGLGAEPRKMFAIVRFLHSILSLFPTILRGFKKDHFCTYKDNGTKHFDTQDEIFNF